MTNPERQTTKQTLGFIEFPFNLRELGEFINSHAEYMEYKLKLDPHDILFTISYENEYCEICDDPSLQAYYIRTETEEECQKRLKNQEKWDRKCFERLKAIYGW